MKKLIGLFLMVAPLVALFGFTWHVVGFQFTVICWSVALALVGMIHLGAWLFCD